MNITTVRLRYSQFFIICLLGVFLYTMSQSLSGGIPQIENNLQGRGFLVNSFTRLRLKFGDRVFPQALVGKEGWLEYIGNRNLDGYQNAITTPPGALEKTQQKLQQLYKILRKRNITLILVIPPNKATIYPDKLPDEIQKLSTQSKLDEFAAYLEQHGPPVFVDLRSALQAGRKKQDLYYKTDTHWNSYGAFIGYTEIMKELSKTYPQLAPKNIKEFKVRTIKSYTNDLAQIMGATYIREPGVKFDPKENALHWVNISKYVVSLQTPTTLKESSPTLLMYKDSFGDEMDDFIASHLSKATVIKYGSTYPDISSLKMIDVVKPDIVIVEMLERYFSIQALDTFLKQFLLG